MKNMVILKNLPSNMVEEAFVVFKNNVKIHKTEKIENQKNDWLDIPDGKVTPSDIAMSIGVYGFMPLAALTSLYFIITTI